MPSATGQNWEKYQKNFADDEIEEKKITPLSDEYVTIMRRVGEDILTRVQGYPGAEDVRSSSLCFRAEEA